jgi:chemotaxis protein methyltransferase CheR
VFVVLQREVLPSLLQKMHRRDDNLFRVWSAGCGSGEEPYTLAILWAREIQALFPYAEIDIVATDADPNVMRRARAASYSFGSLKSLPESWRELAFILEEASYRLRPEYKRSILFLEQDIRKEQPDGPFDLVFCRNLVFTYFDELLQLELLRRIVGAMHVGGALVIGAHEKLPVGAERLSLLHDMQNIYRKSGQLT